jgi:hypothetical protein
MENKNKEKLNSKEKKIKNQEKKSKSKEKKDSKENKNKENKENKNKEKKENKNKENKENKNKENKENKENKNKEKNPKENKEIKPSEQDIGSTIRKWNDNKNRDSKKGTFTSEEIKKIKDSVCQYAFENNLSEQDLINLVTEKQSKKDKNIWPKISECLPERSVQSIHNFCHRSLNPYNYKGNWADEEVTKLIQ